MPDSGFGYGYGGCPREQRGPLKPWRARDNAAKRRTKSQKQARRAHRR